MRLTIAQLSEKTGVPERTIRYYIDRGLVPSAHGERRGAWYDTVHLEPLLRIQQWREAGLSLEAIADLLRGDTRGGGRSLPTGAVEVRSHLVVAEGVELVVAPERADLSSQQIRQLFTWVQERIDLLKSTPRSTEPQE